MLLLNLWKWRTTLDSELSWYSPNATRWSAFYGLEQSLGIHGFLSTWFCLIVGVLVTWTKFLEPSNYCTGINCTCCILTFDPAKNAIQSDAPEGSDTFQWQLWEEIALACLADEMGQGKSHDTLIDWHTGREWPLNCMTVISAWWRSNMPFQRLSGRLSGRWTII